MKPIMFPCLHVKMVPANKVVSNDYNPNKVASPEMKLLALSIEEDGVTQPIVTCYDKDRDLWVVVDGFHRYTILTQWFKCKEIPIVEIEKDIRQRMAATVRHNRARGKHTVDLMAQLVAGLLRKGWKDIEIANHLGMEGEEVLRLKQQTGFADLFKQRKFSNSWDDMDIDNDARIA